MIPTGYTLCVWGKKKTNLNLPIATHEWLAQGLLNVCDIRVEWLLCSLCSRSDHNWSKIHHTVRSFMNFGHTFERFSWRLEEPARQAV